MGREMKFLNECMNECHKDSNMVSGYTPGQAFEVTSMRPTIRTKRG